MCSQPISLKQLFSWVCKCTGLATCLFKRVERMFLMWASAGFHWKSAYNNTFPHEFIFEMTVIHLFKALPRINTTQFDNNFSSRKARERNEIKVCMLGPIITWVFACLNNTKIQTLVLLTHQPFHYTLITCYPTSDPSFGLTIIQHFSVFITNLHYHHLSLSIDNFKFKTIKNTFIYFF